MELTSFSSEPGNHEPWCWICKSQDQLQEFSNTLAAKLSELVYQEVSIENSLPRCICNGCIERLHAAHQFVQECLQAGCRTQLMLLKELKIEKLEPVTDEPSESVVKNEETGVDDQHFEEFEELSMAGSDRTWDSPEEKEDSTEDEDDERKTVAKRRAIIRPTPQTFDCDICEIQFKKRFELHKHWQVHGSKRFKCKECGALFSRRSFLRSHTAVHQDQPSFFCEICSMGFKFKPNLDRHIKGIHLLEKRFACKFCSKAFSQKKGMEAHELTHDRQRTLPCTLCPKMFKLEISLAKHMSRCHETSDNATSGTVKICKTPDKPLEKNIMCEVCGRGFSKKALLKVHMIVHTKETPWACTKCPKKYSWEASLRQHLLMHSNEKPYQCNQCERSFRQHAHLKAHLSVHRGEKPFECVVCKKQFNRRANMNLHMKVHGLGNQDVVVE